MPRIKNTIREGVKGLDFIFRLRAVTCHIGNKSIATVICTKDTPDFQEKYDSDKIKYTGFLAQEVGKVIGIGNKTPKWADNNISINKNFIKGNRQMVLD